MSKDEYIKMISRNGDQYGNCGGLADFLTEYNRAGTKDATERELREFCVCKNYIPLNDNEKENA